MRGCRYRWIATRQRGLIHRRGRSALERRLGSSQTGWH
jgi:hypothetical protein